MRAVLTRRDGLEVLLIILGILSAFSLEAWWERRGLEVLELDYLGAMSQEFSAAADTLDTLAARARWNARNLHLLDSLMSSGRRLAPADSIIEKAGALWYWQPYLMSMPAYDELRATIGINEVSDPGLRRALFEYEAVLRTHSDLEGYLVSAGVGYWEEILASRVPHPTGGEQYRTLGVEPGDLARDLELRTLVLIRLDVEANLEGIREQLAAAAREVVDRIAAISP